jgi:hypothetical protein
MAAPTLSDVMAKLVKIELEQQEQTGLLSALFARSQIMSAEMDTLSAQVTQTLTVEQSALTLIQGIAAQVADAAGDRTKSLALSATLKTSADALAAAIVANTPTPTP